MQNLTISLIQADLYWEEIDANLAMFEESIWSIEQTDLIVLPEMFTTGFTMDANGLAEPAGGKTFKWLRQLATQKNAAITGSYIVKEGGKFYNRMYFVFPDGTAEYYNKKHLFTLAGEDQSYTAGDSRLILEYKGWKIHPLICYDLRFPVWARSQKQEDSAYEYDLLLYVANWPDTRIHAWDTLLRARAIENLAYCVGVNRIGTDQYGKNYTGHTALYDYAGIQQAFSQGKAEIMTIELNAAELKRFRDRFRFQEDADQFTIL